MSTCPYKFDRLPCQREFGHTGDHSLVIARPDREDIPITWDYPSVLRAQDIERGFVPCQTPHPADVDLTCDRPVDHTGDHEGDGWDDEALETKHVHWGDDWGLKQDEPEPEKPKRPVPEQVVAERARRAEMPTHLMAMQRPDGGIERHEIIDAQVADGSLLIRTTDEDVIMPPGSWGPLRIEPTPW